MDLKPECPSYTTAPYFNIEKTDSTEAIMPLITINGNSFDPEAAAVRSFGLNKEDAALTDYIPIQTTGEPLKKEQKIELNKRGVKIQEYVGDDNYLGSYKDNSDLSTLRQLDYVKYANVYLQEFVV